MTGTKLSKNRRGISTVVGALFFTVLMIAGFSALALALDTQTDIVDTQRMISETELKKQQERFSVGASTDEDNNLEIFVNNHGQNPVEIASIWIINKTLSDQPAQRFTIPSDSAYVPSGYGSQILSSSPLTMIPDEYDIKVVSTYGTIEQTELNVNGVSSSNVLRSQLFTVPPDVISGQNVTIAMLVTNTADFTLESVSPANDPPYTNRPSSLVASELTSLDSVTLEPKETMLFKWNAEVSGPLGENMNFSTYASGLEPDSGIVYKSSNSSDTITFQIDGGDDGTLIALSKDLLAKPEIFLTIPSPAGAPSDPSSNSLWGLNIVNPVNSTMKVSKLILTAFSPGGNNNDVLFNLGPSESGCTNLTILSPYGEWSCPSENSIMWQNRTNPIVLSPYSSQPFLAKILSGEPAGNNSIESIIVQASVFTTAGSFGKADYQTTMNEDPSSLGSVYMHPVQDSRDENNIRISQSGISPDSVETFNIVFADLDDDSSTYIKAGAKLIINVPREWKNVTIQNNLGFVDPLTIVEFGDGSTQIIGETTSNLGDGANNADTITFTAQAPSDTSDQLYVMYVLADGETHNSFSAGPLAEILLQVDAP